MKVGDGVIIDGSKLGLNGGLLTGMVEDKSIVFGRVFILLPRKVEAQMVNPITHYQRTMASPDEIIAIIPDQGHWLGKEMP